MSIVSDPLAVLLAAGDSGHIYALALLTGAMVEDLMVEEENVRSLALLLTHEMPLSLRVEVETVRRIDWTVTETEPPLVGRGVEQHQPRCE